jgi:Rrf2 family protein
MPVSASQLAREGHMPERFLLQVLRCLVTHGTLRSAGGVSGGYFLARSPKQISLREIIEAFDNPLDVTLAELKCLPPTVRSKVFETLQAGADSARASFQKLAVADLLQHKRKR